MSLLGLIDTEAQDPGLPGVGAPSTEFMDVAGASFNAAMRAEGAFSKELVQGFETRDRDGLYKKLTGRSIIDDATEFVGAQDFPNDPLGASKVWSPNPQEQQKIIDRYLVDLKTKDPDKFKDIKSSSDVLEAVKQKANQAIEAQAKTSAGATGFAAVTGQIAGGLAGGFTDPLNLATIPLGAGLASGVLKTALIEAGVNAGTEVVAYPFVKKWKEELGRDYGPQELLENMGLSALFGFAIGGGAKGLQFGLEKLDLPNSAKLSEIRSRLEEIKDNPESHGFKTERPIDEVIQAVRHEERRLQIEEANPARYSDEIDPMAHQRALEEVDAAFNEGRSLDPSKLGVTDEQIRKLDASKMDALTAELHSKITEGVATPARVTKSVNPIVDLNTVSAPGVARQKELVELRNSPEYKAKEATDFEQTFKEVEDEKIFGDSESGDKTVADLKERFESDRAYLNAIRTCGLGGKV